jgi:ribonuclease J
MDYEGIITLIMNINSKTDELQSTPQFVAQGVRGFESPNGGSVSNPTSSAAGNGSKNLFKDAERIVSAAIAGASKKTFEDESLLKEHVRVELKRFIQKETGAKPVIVPVIQQI